MGGSNLIQGIFQANNDKQTTEDSRVLMESADQGKVETCNQTLFDNRREREWLTTREAAHFLAVSPNALRIMVHRNQIEAYKIGHRLRFRLKDCRALFQKKGA
jgi:excisionase family DNA binding protein